MHECWSRLPCYMLQVWSWGETWFIINCISNLSSIYTFLDGIKNWGFTNKKLLYFILYMMTCYCLQLTLFKQILAYYYIAWCFKECFDVTRYLILKKMPTKMDTLKKIPCLVLTDCFSNQTIYLYLPTWLVLTLTPSLHISCWKENEHKKLSM